MSRRALAASLLPLALVLGGLTVGSTSASATDPPAPVRIMVNGDSITQGFDGDYTWRYRLWGTLTQQVAKGARAFDFVGPYRWAYGTSSYYRGTPGWDSDHDSFGASRLHEHLAGDAYAIAGVPSGSGQTPMEKYHPDVLISFLGTNDLLNGMALLAGRTAEEKAEGTATLVQQTVDDYKLLITQVRAVNPDIKIVLGEVMTHDLGQQVRTAYNQALADQVVSDVTGMSTAQSPITLARLDDPADGPKWESSTYTSDRIHPTPSGELVIAQKFALGLYAVEPDLFTQPPAIAQIIVPWNPTLAPSIAVRKRRIYLQSGATMRKNGVLAMRIRLTTVRTKRVGTGGFVQSTSWHSGLLAPGYYRVQMQGLRKNMISAWSKAYTVKVPAPPKRKKKRR